MLDHQSLRSACAYTQSDQSLSLSFECSMTPRLLTKQHLESLSLKGGCTGSSESTLVKMPHCWKSHVVAHIYFTHVNSYFFIDCGNLTDPTNGSVSFTLTTYNELVSYTCDPGFTLTGSSSRICQQDATWSSSAPNCIIKGL